ncbi:MAG: acylphosphatase [Candidatus Marinimicrobia bacterium]|jgi:acylphosphatase|nr:acylphosphatase [Candidatus Neomarinimicrobiota bacterium]MDP6593191.1 acylphosphatase [Candidatus Neomarinimicrobiota bacterium]MDP6836004.1 acylphosphatase [Candidatus Neomarinimicrobiota bacterium]|tara:strand:+ start:5923 stop:6204 length:282 start_codon:yes stop_codon:yes gene_type:complete
MSEKASAFIRITGRVQMVGYRFFTQQWAEDFYLDGWVRNNPDGSVSAEVEGKKTTIEKLITELKQGPRIASVDEVDVKWGPFKKRFRGFRIKY